MFSPTKVTRGYGLGRPSSHIKACGILPIPTSKGYPVLKDHVLYAQCSTAQEDKINSSIPVYTGEVHGRPGRHCLLFSGE